MARRHLLALLLPLLGLGRLVIGGPQTAFLQYGLGGAACLMAGATLPPLAWVGIVALAGAIHPFLTGTEPGPICGALGLAALIVGGPAILWARDPVKAEGAAVGAALFPLLVIASGRIRIGLGNHAATYDLYAEAWDETLCGPIAFQVGRVFQRHPWLGRLHRTVYDALPLAMGAAYGLTPLGRRSRLLLLILGASALGFACYHLVPIAGPRYAFPSFPAAVALPQLTRLDLPVWAERNGMPSLHLTWALLLAVVAWEQRGVVRWLSVTFATLTAVATLGLGEHYLVDLLGALPLTWLLWRLLGQRAA